MKKAYIYSNTTELSTETYEKFKATLPAHGYELSGECGPDVELIACIGGDGTFLSFIHECGFPSCNVIGINTGHLGFFQEALPDQIDYFWESYESGKFAIQKANLISCEITHGDGTENILAINEFTIKGPSTHLTHFSITIGDTPIEEYSGDGLLICSPAGSTAYNYSLSGAIVAPELDLLQITPIAPMNTNAYRSFHSSIIVPPDKKIHLIPSKISSVETLDFYYDGRVKQLDHVGHITLEVSDKSMNLIRFEGYDYWTTLKSKLL
jgi:NAD+ kinase